jgi:hypothetical protein
MSDQLDILDRETGNDWLSLIKSISHIRFIRDEMQLHFVLFPSMDSENQIKNFHEKTIKLIELDNHHCDLINDLNEKLKLHTPGRYDNVKLRTLMDIIKKKYDDCVPNLEYTSIEKLLEYIDTSHKRSLYLYENGDLNG